MHNACNKYACLAVQVLRLLSSVPRREGGDGVGTHQNTWESCISPPVQCSTDHLQFTAVRIDTLKALLHSSPEVKYRAVLLKLLPLTLGEYKFGINWFSAKMWSVKPRKIKTPGEGELAVQPHILRSVLYFTKLQVLYMLLSILCNLSSTCSLLSTQVLCQFQRHTFSDDKTELRWVLTQNWIYQ